MNTDEFGDTRIANFLFIMLLVNIPCEPTTKPEPFFIFTAAGSLWSGNHHWCWNICLIGELAGISGYLAPVSFLLASLIAGLTAMSFAELSGRYPRCAGAALYVKEGFSADRLSMIVGLLVIAAGLVSSAALVNGFVGYLHEFIELERQIAIALVVLSLGFIAAWGIKESVIFAAIVTVIEIGGLLLVIAVSVGSLEIDSPKWGNLLPSLDTASFGSIYAGSLLAFYALSDSRIWWMWLKKPSMLNETCQLLSY